MNKIALTMIVKGTGKEPARLRRALSSLLPNKYVDAAFVTLTGPRNQMGEAEKVCKEFGVNVSYGDFLYEVEEEAVKWLTEYLGHAPSMKVGDKLFEFDKARNYNLAQVSKDEYPWILWMDCDDIFRGGEKLHDMVTMADKQDVEAFFLNYLYEVLFDEKGEIKDIIIEHERERLVRNNGHFKWIAPIHEALIEQVPTRKSEFAGVDVLHLSDPEDKRNAITRNLPNLELAIYRTEGKDPRHLYYLAKAYIDLAVIHNEKHYNDYAIPLMLEYLYGEHKSGWPQERSQCSVMLAELYRRKNEINNSTKCLLNALVEFPREPTIFVNLAINCVLKKEWDNALFWVQQASSVPEGATTLVRNPYDLKGMTLEVLYNIYVNTGQIDKAYKTAQGVLELAPESKEAKDAFNWISQLREQRDITKKVVDLVEYLKKTGERHKIKPLLAGVPAIAEQTPFIQDLFMKNNPPTAWGSKEITIYCGPGVTPWSPKTLENPGTNFMGGSEEAVVCVSRALAKLGWKVTVYNDPMQEEGEHDGVRYLPYYKFNVLDNFNILIIWRMVGLFSNTFKAKKKYLWLHDIANPLEYTKERIDQIDKVFFLSEWHRNNVSELPNEKVFLTSNGI